MSCCSPSQTIKLPIVLELFETTDALGNGQQPTGSPIASGSVAPFNDFTFEWCPFDLGGPVHLDANTTYAFVVTSDDPGGYGWAGSQPGDYPDGNFLTRAQGDPIFAQQPNTDGTFRLNGTFIPEPASVGLLVCGFAGIGCLRRRKR